MVLHPKLADLGTLSSAYVSEFNEVPTSKDSYCLVTSEAPFSRCQSVVCNSRWSVLSSYCNFIYNNGTTQSGPCSVQEYEALTCKLWVCTFEKQSAESVQLRRGVAVAASKHSPGQFCVHNTDYYEKSAITKKSNSDSHYHKTFNTKKYTVDILSTVWHIHSSHLCWNKWCAALYCARTSQSEATVKYMINLQDLRFSQHC
jgi:hypothetical protein